MNLITRLNNKVNEKLFGKDFARGVVRVRKDNGKFAKGKGYKVDHVEPRVVIVNYWGKPKAYFFSK